MLNEKYWIVYISKNHIEKGVYDGFIQACHGKASPLKRMHKGDGVLVYSSRVEMDGKPELKSFTAIGRVLDDIVYPYQISDNFIPFRKNIEYLNCKEVSILPLIDLLDFIPNKKHCGATLYDSAFWK